MSRIAHRNKHGKRRWEEIGSAFEFFFFYCFEDELLTYCYCGSLMSGIAQSARGEQYRPGCF